jgi:hypothetical protein
VHDVPNRFPRTTQVPHIQHLIFSTGGTPLTTIHPTQPPMLTSHMILFCLPFFFFGFRNNIIIRNCLDWFMGNQYSITVSDETDSILQSMKNNGYKMSQVIDAAVSTIGEHGLQRLIRDRRALAALKKQTGGVQ